MTSIPSEIATQATNLAACYRDALLENVIPFWMRHSPDRDHGGYFTCLDAKGRVYDTDKFVWLQARQVWMFSVLFNRVEKRQEWLDVARLGAEFLRTHGRDAAGDWYFSLTREGAPLVQPYNIFSDCFAAMAFSQYAVATGDDSARDISRAAWDNVMRRRANPKGRFAKAVPGTRPMTSYSLPMITSNLALELEWFLGAEEVERALDECVDAVMDRFLDPERGIIHEHIAPDGSHPDTFDGRLINPGHGLEGAWFLMAVGERRGDRALIERCIDVAFNMLEFGWDLEHSGIFYYMDSEGRPPDKLEWDQKLWWVHAEAMVAMAMAARLTGRDAVRENAWKWFIRLHDYCWTRFADPQNGEWYGYLNREGEILLRSKGGKWKGCFHLPRACLVLWREMEKLAHREAPPQV